MQFSKLKIGQPEQKSNLICNYSYWSYMPTFIDVPWTMWKKGAKKHKYFNIDKTFSREWFTNISPKGFNSNSLPKLSPVHQKAILRTVFCYPKYTITGHINGKFVQVLSYILISFIQDKLKSKIKIFIYSDFFLQVISKRNHQVMFKTLGFVCEQSGFTRNLFNILSDVSIDDALVLLIILNVG